MNQLFSPTQVNQPFFPTSRVDSGSVTMGNRYYDKSVFWYTGYDVSQDGKTTTITKTFATTLDKVEALKNAQKKLVDNLQSDLPKIPIWGQIAHDVKIDTTSQPHGTANPIFQHAISITYPTPDARQQDFVRGSLEGAMNLALYSHIEKTLGQSVREACVDFAMTNNSPIDSLTSARIGR